MDTRLASLACFVLIVVLFAKDFKKRDLRVSLACWCGCSCRIALGVVVARHVTADGLADRWRRQPDLTPSAFLI